MPTAKIQDVAYNPLADPSATQMLGYAETTTEEILTLDMYRFLALSIREEDKKNNFFVQKFVQGFQDVWETIQEKIFDVKKLWSIEECPDEYLQYLKAIVGWTGKAESVTTSLNYITLRKLIANSVSFWKTRGTEDALVNIINLTTQAVAIMYNWFDYRWIVEETGLGEEQAGSDSWMIDNPGDPFYGEYRSTLRVVDDGTLDKDLIKNLAKLNRAVGERIDIIYLGFLDLFRIDGDETQWTTPDGNLIVASGVAELSNSSIFELSSTSVTGSDDWDNYNAYFKIKGTHTATDRFGCGVYCSNDGDAGYFVQIDVSNNNIVVRERAGGGWTTVHVTFDYSVYGVLKDDTYYGVRIQIVEESSTNRIIVYFDGDEIANITDVTITKGNLTIYHDSDATIALDEIEMFKLPASIDTVEINT